MLQRVVTALLGLLLFVVLAPTPSSAVDCSDIAQTSVERYVQLQNRYEEWITVDLYFPASADGRPLTRQGCRYPVVLESSPYRDWTSPQPTKVDGAEERRRTWWVGRGYVYAFADVPGAGGADGRWCLWCRHEQLSGVDIVNALGRARWSNGNVGMIGGSYPAINALLIAQHRPKHLKALIVAAPLTDPYTDFFFVGGMRRFEDSATLLAAFTGLAKWTGIYQAPREQTQAERFLEVWTNRATSPPAEFTRIQDDHPTRDAWYEERTIHPERIAIPTYILGGWNDIFDRSTWRLYDRLATKEKFLVQGPFTHVPLFMPPGAWPCSTQNIDFCGAPVFDRFLRGARTAASAKLERASVRAYVQPSGPYIVGRAKPRTQTWTIRLAKSGTGTIRYQPAAGATSGRWFYRGSVPGAYPPFDTYLGVDGPPDQRVEEQTALSLASAPLKKDVTILGGGRASLRVTADASDGDVVVRIVDEYPAGDSQFPAGHGTVIGQGWLRASHRAGHSAEEIRPLAVGKPTRLDVELWPTGYRIKKGHRLRVDLYPADTPRMVPQSGPFSFTVDLARSAVGLPTLGSQPPLVLTQDRN